MLSRLVDVRRAVVLARSMAAPIPEHPARIAVVLKEMGLEDLERFRQASMPERRIRRFAEQLHRGRIGVMALSGDAVAGYGWLSVENEVESWVGAEVCLEPGEGYVYDGFTLPAFRGRGIYPVVLGWRLHRLRDLGCRVVYSVVAAGNAPTLRWHERLGFEEARRIGYVRVAMARWCFERRPETRLPRQAR